MNCQRATPSVWGNLTGMCFCSNAEVKMNYRRRVVTQNKRNWIDALKPKGTKSGYSGSNYIIENGHQIFGSKVAPKTSTIIHSMELGKPYVFPFG